MIGNKNPKILFYAGISYSFRSLAIGQVYEIAQKYSVVLLTEKLDQKTENTLRNKNIFPKLEKIIYIKNNWIRIIRNNKSIYLEFKNIIKNEKPDIVISNGKYIYPVTLYLRRIAKKNKAINICYLGIQPDRTKVIALWKMLVKSYLKREPIFFTKLKAQIAHIFVYWILPLLVGEKPFLKEPGGVLLKNVFSDSCDYYLCYLKKEYNLCLEEGADKNKLRLVSNGSYFLRYQKPENGSKIATIMWPTEKIGIRKDNLSLISKEEIIMNRRKVLKMVNKILFGWKIFVKPHPSILKEELFELSEIIMEYPNFKLTNPADSADDYIRISDVVVGLPPVSSTSYTASLNYPEKAILCVNFENQLLGNGCKNFDGVEYIEKEEKFIGILNQIRAGGYKKNWKKKTKEDFPNIVDLIGAIINKNE